MCVRKRSTSQLNHIHLTHHTHVPKFCVVASKPILKDVRLDTDFKEERTQEVYGLRKTNICLYNTNFSGAGYRK